ncbi:MAG: hypothetical protein ACR2PL_13945, partial [Dehalococcoidia bacterium]
YRLVVAAVRAAAGGDRFPEERLGPPYRVERLFTCAFPQGLFRPQYEKMLHSDLAAEVRLVDPRRLGVPSSEMSVAVPVEEFADGKLRALACHRSQYDGDDPRAIFPPGVVDRLLQVEYFHLEGPTPAGRPLTDIFAEL